MEPSTAPPKALPKAAAKHALEAPVVPLASPQVVSVAKDTDTVLDPAIVEMNAESTGVLSTKPHSVRSPVRVKRTITRYAFEFFQDQIETLRRFSLDEKMCGEQGSMSQMVREAIDAYLAKRNRTDV